MHIPFPKIRQFKDAINNVNYKCRYLNGMNEDGSPTKPEPPPKLDYIGTVKLHGTNAAIQLEQGKLPVYQSRNRIITPIDDNMGFAAAMHEFAEEVGQLWSDIIDTYTLDEGHGVTVYGEWCGEGIQQGVAISKLPKMFVIFAIRHEDTWLDVGELDTEAFATIHDFATYWMTIDFELPTLSQNEMVALTDSVEKLCPVGYDLGVEGVGEGIVWRCVTPGWESSKFWFKVKGQKHSEHNVRVLKEIDPNLVMKAQDFVDSVVTVPRLMKGIDYLKEMSHPVDRTSTGIFLKWVGNDVYEEEIDTMIASGLTKKDVGKPMSIVARTWWFAQL